MAKGTYTIPNSTVGKKISAQTPLPQSLVKGSCFSKVTTMSGGHMLKSGTVGKIAVPGVIPSPPAKTSGLSPSAPPSPPAKK